MIMASPPDMAQIKSIVAAIDTAAPTPSPKPRYPAEAVRVTQRPVKDIARAVAASSPGVKVSVSGSEILLVGPQDDVDHAKQLISELDVPQLGTQFTQVYRIKYVDANSVADLFRRSYANLPVQVNADLNAITVTANITTQRRLADAIDQPLTSTPPGANGGGQGGGGGGSGVEVIELHAAVPGLNGGPSTSANDIAQTVTQALQATAPDLHIVVPPSATQLVLTGTPYSIKLAKELIAKLDTPPILVALDTEVLALAEGTPKQLGLKFPTAAVTTTFTEVAPVYPVGNANCAGQQIPFLNLFLRSFARRCRCRPNWIFWWRRTRRRFSRIRGLRRFPDAPLHCESRRDGQYPHDDRRWDRDGRDHSGAVVPDRRDARHYTGRQYG